MAMSKRFDMVADAFRDIHLHRWVFTQFPPEAVHLTRHPDTQHLRLLALRKLLKERLNIEALSILGWHVSVFIVRCGALSGVHRIPEWIIFTLLCSAIGPVVHVRAPVVVVVVVVVVVIHC